MSKNLLMETKLEELHETSVGLTTGAEELRTINRQLEQVDKLSYDLLLLVCSNYSGLLQETVGRILFNKDTSYLDPLVV